MTSWASRDRVRFLGWVDPAAVLGGCDVFALASDREGWPMAVVEAHHRGVPVVATAVGSVPELIEDGSTGVLVAPGDLPAMVRAIGAVRDDPARASAMGEQARAAIVSGWTPSAMARCYERELGVAAPLAGGADVSRHLHPAIRHPRTWTAQRRHPRGLVLMYHSVGAVDVDPWGLFIDPANFADHLATIETSHTPMRLADLARAQSSSTLPSRAVAVTFDDGYLNNLIEALPLLERYEVPATVFVIAGAVGTDREFWWDELEQMITGPARLDGELRLDGTVGPAAPSASRPRDGVVRSEHEGGAYGPVLPGVGPPERTGPAGPRRCVGGRVRLVRLDATGPPRRTGPSAPTSCATSIAIPSSTSAPTPSAIRSCRSCHPRSS